MIFVLIAAGWLGVIVIVVAACRMAAVGDVAMARRSRSETPAAKRVSASEAHVPARPAERNGIRRRTASPAIGQARAPGAR
jgi:hypothetical protein